MVRSSVVRVVVPLVLAVVAACLAVVPRADAVGSHPLAQSRATARSAVVTVGSAPTVVNTTTGLGGHRGALHRGQAIAIPLFGRGGVPANGALAVVLKVHALHTTAPVALSFAGQGVPQAPRAALHTGPATTKVFTVTAPLGQNGTAVITDWSKGPFGLRIRVVGYRPLPADTGWPQEAGGPDAANSAPGADFTPANLSHVQPAWTAVSTGSGDYFTNTVVSDGVVYGAGRSRSQTAASLTARSLATGRVLWHIVGETDQVAVYDGLVYVSSFGWLRAVSIATHNVVWAARVASTDLPSMMVGGGHVFADIGDEAIAVDAATGRPQKTFADGHVATIAGGYAVIQYAHAAKTDVIDENTLAEFVRLPPTYLDDTVITDGWVVSADYDGFDVEAWPLRPCHRTYCAPAWNRRFTVSTKGDDFDSTRLVVPSPGVVAYATSGQPDTRDAPNRPATIHRLRVRSGTTLPDIVFPGSVFTMEPVVAGSAYVFGLDGRLSAVSVNCTTGCHTSQSHLVRLPVPKNPDHTVPRSGLQIAGDALVYRHTSDVEDPSGLPWDVEVYRLPH